MYKLLIAEDESEMRRLLVKYISREETDFELVGSAENGKEALNMVHEFSPDIVITDISMPIMDGLAFLQETAKQNISLKTIIISGYDEFEYAKQAIALGVSEYLLKPFDPQELKKVLRKIKSELDSQKILLDNMQLLKEKIDTHEMVMKEQVLRAVLLGKDITRPPEKQILDISADFYCVSLIKLPFYNYKENWKVSEQENIDELIMLLSGGCIPEEIQIQGVSLKENGIILILTGNAKQKQHFFMRIRDGLSHFKKSMEKYYDVQLICIIGQVYESWTDIRKSYEETLKEWKGLAKNEQQMIVCGEKIPAKTPGTVVDSSKKIRGLKEQILLSARIGQEAEAQKYLEELIQIYASISPGKTDYVAISAEELVYAIFNEIEQSGCRLDEKVTNEQLYNEMKKQLNDASLLEIRELLYQCFRWYQELLLKNKEKSQTKVMVEGIKELIEANLGLEELTLEWIAQKVHFSAIYVRQIFKQETGEPIMEYVISKRMEKAAKMLKKSDVKIQDVANECGYSNQRYFASSFKKYYGCTPTDFKDMME